MFQCRRVFSVSLFLWLATAGWVFTKDEPAANTGENFTEDQKIQFMLNAKVVSARQHEIGVTGPWDLTLSDGTTTHLVSFNKVDERKPVMTFSDGRTEINFRDFYGYNIAAYQVAKLLGMDDMVPLYIERKWRGNSGSFSWWIPNIMMDEKTRHAKGMAVPEDKLDAWNKQMYKVRVLDELIYDTDPNMTNIQITKNWKIWRHDFTRAFREQKSLMDVKNLEKCDRQLLERLKKLDEGEVLDKTKPYVSKGAVRALMARRDKIVAQFEYLVAQKGENAVLY